MVRLEVQPDYGTSGLVATATAATVTAMFGTATAAFMVGIFMTLATTAFVLTFAVLTTAAFAAAVLMATAASFLHFRRNGKGGGRNQFARLELLQSFICRGSLTTVNLDAILLQFIE